MDVETDVMVSWLPLYHDMGLVGLLTTSMSFGLDLVQAAPAGLPRPSRPLAGVDLDLPGHGHGRARTSRGCWPPGPCGGWTDLDLSSLRIALNGAEPIDPDAVEAFTAAAAPFGFRPGAVFCAFGMAEVAIAGTFPEPLRGMRCDAVDRVRARGEALRRAGRSAASTAPAACRCSGKAVPGLEIRIVEPDTGEVLRRPPGGRAPDPRHVGDARLLQAARRHRRAAARRLAPHRRPRLPARRRAGAVRAHQGRHHRRRPQRVPRGHRAGRRHRSTACGPAT